MSAGNPALKFWFAARILWSRKWVVAAGTAFAAAVGLAYALWAPPVYRVTAVIYPQDVSAKSEKPVFGGLNNALNPLAGAGHLNRVEILLNSREMARRVIQKNNLIPLLFPGAWQPGTDPRNGVDAPVTLWNGVEKLGRMISTHVDVYRMTLEIRTEANDPRLAFKITQAYLDGLNDRLKEGVVRTATANREYLETQLYKTTDPSSREKIQDLIIREIETSMLLNASGFEILDYPEIPEWRESPKRKKIVLLSVAAGFALSCVGVLALRAARNLRTEMDSFTG